MITKNKQSTVSKQKQRFVPVSIIIILVLMVAIGIAYFYRMPSWTTYTNKTYGYGLKFPATYEVPSQTEKEISKLGIDKNIVVKKKSDPSGSSVIMIDVNLNDEGLSLKDYMNKNLKLFGITDPLASYNFNGYDSLFNKNQYGINVFVKNGNNLNSSGLKGKTSW